MTFRRAVAGLMALLRRRSLDQEMEGEFAAHLELAERDFIAQGLSAEEARLAARQRFGGVAQMKEEHRDQRSLRLLDTLARDFRYGLLSLMRDSGFTAAIVAVLALGIGANTAMFTIVDAVLLKPLPFPESDRIVGVWEAPRPGVVNDTTTLDFLDWKRLGTVFEALSAEQSISASLTGNGEPARLPGKAVTADFFRVFGSSAEFGRTFTADDERPGAQPVVVLSHSAWQTYFGGDPGILRRKPVLDGQAHQIIGVLPPGVFDRDEARFWKALAFTPEQRSRENHWLAVYGRLRGGVTLAQARERMKAIYAALAQPLPDVSREASIAVEPLERLITGNNLRRSLLIAFGAVVLVLLIACANVANLLLGKGVARQKELAVRAALGASRGRLVVQLLTESLALCVLGGVFGVVLAYFLILGINTNLPQILPYTANLSIDLRVIGFAGIVTLLVVLLAGALPALRASGENLAQPLNQAGRSLAGGHAGVRRAIVIGELALSLVLVGGALLLLRTLLNLQRLDTGVQIEKTITMSVDLPVRSYPTAARAASFYTAVIERLRAAPGVAQAALSSQLPLTWITNGEALQIVGIGKPVRVRLKRVDSGYFRTFGIPLLAGRGITDQDRAGTPGVIVINEALAARLSEVAGFAKPTGHRVRLSTSQYTAKGMQWADVEIAGVIRSERVSSPGFPDPPVAYVPLAQLPRPAIKLIVKTLSEPASVMPAIREAVRQIDPNLPLGDIATMQQVRDRTLSSASRPAWLIGAFAVLAALLTAVGLYGVLSHSVTQQRREIGIRMALGARSGDVLRRVLQNALATVLVGLTLGMFGVFALTKVMRGLLYEVSPLDPVTLAVACCSMALIGLLAGFIPANRAAHVDPVITLRDEG